MQKDAELISPELARRLTELGLLPTGAEPPRSVAELVDRLGAAPRPDMAALCAPAATRHRVLAGGGERFTNCAMDALILPFLERTRETIVSVDPVSGEEIRLELGPDGTVISSHPDAVLSFGVARHGDGPIQEVGCPYINLFTDEPSYRRWAKSNPEVLSVMLSLGDAISLAGALGDNT